MSQMACLRLLPDHHQKQKIQKLIYAAKVPLLLITCILAFTDMLRKQVPLWHMYQVHLTVLISFTVECRPEVPGGG